MIALASSASAVRFRREIIDARSGLVLRSTPWTRNLILDGGLEMRATVPHSVCWKVLCLGTGSKLTKRDSGTTTAALAGNTATADAAFFEADDVGRTLKFDSSANEYRVTSYTSPTEVQVTPAGTVASSEFTMWYGNEVTHGTELLRVAQYATDPGMNFSSYAGGVWTFQRTFLTDAFAVGTLVKEIGWSNSATPGAQLYGRALIPGGGDFVGAGQQYRVQVQLLDTWAPLTPQAQANVCADAGFDTSGNWALQSVYGTSNVNAAGGTDVGDGSNGAGALWCLDPLPFTASVRLSNDTTALGGTVGTRIGPAGTAYGTYYNNAGAAAYVAGSHRRYWSAGWGVNDANSTTIRSASWGIGSFGNSVEMRVLFSADQTKDSLHTLGLDFGLAWGRILTN